MRRTITNEIWEQIKTAYASGLGLRRFARNTGIPEGTVLARAKREGWTQQIQNAKTLVKHEDSALAVSPSEAVAMSMQRRGERHVERIAGVSERGVDHIETNERPRNPQLGPAFREPFQRKSVPPFSSEAFDNV
jgi:hypothetical protein